MTNPSVSRVRRGGRGREASSTLDKPAVWPGVLGGRYKPLNDQEVQNVEAAVLHLMETLGFSQAIPSMVELVSARGGKCEKGRLKFPRSLVEEALSKVRRDVVLWGRRPGLELDLSGSRVHMSSGGASPDIRDINSGQYRGATALDLYNAARVVDSLDHVHHFSRSMVARDAPDPLSMDINTAYACLAGTAKHISISASDPSHVKIIADLCYQLAGGEEAFRAKPFMTIMVCHVVPPMRFAEEACETLEEAVKAGFPVQIISAGQAGATSPASVAGSLVQAIAETLAGLVFAWLVEPDSQLIFAPKPLVADLRTGAMSGGGGEQAILMAAAAQMGRHFNLPTSSIAGITDSKLADAQAGYEKNLAVSLAAHAGSNLITQACGMQASLLGCALESYLVDNDMLGNILRSVRGVEADPESIAADVIAEACLGEGHYLGHDQTLARMKSDYVYPQIGDRQTPTDWEAEGGTTIRERAIEKTKELLETYYPTHLSDADDHALRESYNILLSRSDIGRA